MSVPGVEAVAFSQSVPFTGLDNSTRVAVTGAITSDSPSTHLRFVTAEYFGLMRIPLRAGRGFTGTDDGSAPAVAIVNSTFARQHFGNDQQALGRMITLGWGGDGPKQIVGIIGDVRHAGPSTPPAPETYVPHTQFGNSSMSALIRMRDGVAPRAPDIHAALTRVEPAIARQPLRALDTYRLERLSAPRFGAAVLGGFGVLALTLAVVGVYGVVNYVTTLRTREIGVRLALGASHASVFVLVVGQVVTPIGAGLGVGLLMAVAAGRSLSPWLYEVTPTDPATLVGVCVALTLSALAATIPPARRATRVDPARTLRAR